MTRRRLLILPLLLVATAMPAAGSAAAGDQMGLLPTLAGILPCKGVLNITLSPLQPGQTVSAILSILCLKLPLDGPSKSSFSRTPRREQAASSVIGQDFDRPNGGTLLVQWSGASGGCSGGRSYAVGNVGLPLNDRFESSRSFSACTRNPHYQNLSYTGAVLPCGSNCNLGWLSNQTSSERWLP
jgi:hypothetical protein